MRRGISGVVLALAVSAGGTTAAYARDISMDGAPLRTPAALDCPASEGALTRVAQAPDGRFCDYQGPAGEWVRLSLVALDGRSPSEVLAPAKAELYALAPVYEPPARTSIGDEPGEVTKVDLPFIHVRTVGDSADVKVFGIKIHAKGDNTDVDLGRGRKNTVVRAGLKGAQVTSEEIGRTNASLIYVLAADRRMSSGYWTVGYVAKGPVNGPLVKAEFRTTQKNSRVRDGDHGDIGRLIDRNVKG
jgi:hypothetical protein